tara:strand:- start:16 stop:231 length:216 start_codon:yes stop_codon:yes gene_type:complete
MDFLEQINIITDVLTAVGALLVMRLAYEAKADWRTDEKANLAKKTLSIASEFDHEADLFIFRALLQKIHLL